MYDSETPYRWSPSCDLWGLGQVILDMFGKSSNTIFNGMEDFEIVERITRWLPAGDTGERNCFQSDPNAPTADDFPDAGDVADVETTLAVAFELLKSRPSSRLGASGAAMRLR